LNLHYRYLFPPLPPSPPMDPLDLTEGWDRGEVLEALNLEVELEPYAPRFEFSPFFLELYVDHGHETGLLYKYEDDDMIVFLSARHSEHGREYRVFRPLRTDRGVDDHRLFKRFGEFIKALTDRRDTTGVTVFGVPDRKNLVKIVQSLRWKGVIQYVYDVPNSRVMEGRAYKDLREKVNRFSRYEEEQGIRMEEKPLEESNFGDVYEIVRKWKKFKHEKQDTYGLDERINKLEAILEDVEATVYYLKGRPVSVHAAYELETELKAAGHFLGLCALKLPGLYETSQIRFWTRLYNEKGILKVNDGPTWVKNLVDFKKKFVPKKTLRVYQGYYANLTVSD